MPYKIGNKEYTLEEIKEIRQFVDELTTALKHDPGSSTPSVTPLHGPWHTGTNLGMFTEPGVRPEMYSAVAQPRTAVEVAGFRPSQILKERIGILTGQLEGTGNNPADGCGDPPKAGALKKCVQVYEFGDYVTSTGLADAGKVGMYLDRADVARRIMNQRANPDPLVPDAAANANIQTNTGSLLATELFKVGTEVRRQMARVMITGDSSQAYNATERGFIREFDGLEKQVIEGRVDTTNGAACPAADSIVVDYDGGFGDDLNGLSFVENFTNTFHQIMDLADTVGLNVQMGIFMRSHAFYNLAGYWACNYQTARCLPGTQGGVVSNLTASEIYRERVDMINNRYLMIDGMRVPVFFHDGIPQTYVDANNFSASIFGIPLFVDGVKMLNFEYLPQDNPEAAAWTGFVNPETDRITNNGLYRMRKNTKNFCDEYIFRAILRLILDAPFLAFRYDQVQYASAGNTRPAYPGESGYVNGGVSFISGE